MSHFAKVVDGVVEAVIVAEQDFVDTQEGIWVQTSYNARGGQHFSYRLENQEQVDGDGNNVTLSVEVPYADGGSGLRKNYARVGSIYDAGRDAFYEEKPFPSWSLNENTCLWDAPTAYPDDGKDYNWNEDSLAWVEVDLSEGG